MGTILALKVGLVQGSPNPSILEVSRDTNYLALTLLERKNTMIEVEFEGSTLICEKIEYDFSNLAPGDTYIGKRNQGWKMGTVSERLWDTTKAMGYIYGNENIYPYNIGECLKVLEVR